jgi:MFS family permease
MLPLSVFRSRTFSVINILTLLLYAALGGALFFLPFALNQVRGYPATFAGAAFLPFTIIMAGLSRWAGGLLDRFGARLPLVTGPAISALGLGLMASMVAGGAYWEFLVAIVILGFGMLISVAPLTTTVMNSVSANQTGIASGINNAVDRWPISLQLPSSVQLRSEFSTTHLIAIYKMRLFRQGCKKPSMPRTEAL